MSIATETHKFCRMVFGQSPVEQLLPADFAGQKASDIILSQLESCDPCMITRFGSTELGSVVATLDSQIPGTKLEKFRRYINGESGFYWYTRGIKRRMRNWSGFFPAEPEWLDRFGMRILDDIEQFDVVGTWRTEERRLADRLEHVTTVPLDDLYPANHARPWTTALEGRKVLVVHPFDESIRRQYAKRKLLFADERMLPQFKLRTLKAVQSIAGETPPFPNWFAALEHMRRQVSVIDFDIAIIGAGAYGMPLAADVKRMGKKAIHLGGITQIMFGIKGNRWASLNHLFNRYWVRPLASETPRRAQLVEGACYW